MVFPYDMILADRFSSRGSPCPPVQWRAAIGCGSERMPDERFVRTRADVFEPCPRVGFVFDRTTVNALHTFRDNVVAIVGFTFDKFMPWHSDFSPRISSPN